LSNDFNSAKEALLKYYSDTQISLGARLIGYIVALFTLFEAVSNFSKSGFSDIFLGVTITTDPFTSFAKLALFFVGTWLLIIYIIRTIFRYAACAGFCNYLMGLPPPKDGSKPLNHGAISTKVYRKMLGKRVKVFFIFPFNWFLSGNKGGTQQAHKDLQKDTFSGWIVSIAIGKLVTLALFWLFC
jgi:hypothetical protein